MLLKWCLLLCLALFEAHFASATVYGNGSKVICWFVWRTLVVCNASYKDAL